MARARIGYNNIEKRSVRYSRKCQTYTTPEIYRTAAIVIREGCIIDRARAPLLLYIYYYYITHNTVRRVNNIARVNTTSTMRFSILSSYVIYFRPIVRYVRNTVHICSVRRVVTNTFKKYLEFRII